MDWKIGTETRFHMENSKIKEKLKKMMVISLIIHALSKLGLWTRKWGGSELLRGKG